MRGSIKKRYEGSWTIRLDMGYKVDPDSGLKKRNQKTFTVHGTKKQAEAKLAELLRDFNRGQLVEPSKVTFGEWLDTWVESAVKPPNRRQSTYLGYKAIIANYIRPALGNIRLQALKAADIKRYYTDSKLAPATLQVHHAIMSSALKAAMLDDLVPRNPASLVVGKPSVRKAGPSEEVVQHCWEVEEARRFLTEARKRDTQTAAFYALALDSGARKGELLGLKWSDINFSKGAMSITRQLYKPGSTPVFTPTKTGESRTVTLSQETLGLLRKHKTHQLELKLANRASYHDHDLVFAKEWKEQQKNSDVLGDPLRPGSVGQREYRDIIEKAGIKYIKLHGLRHTCATLLLQADVPIKVVSERLGHRKVEVTLSVYSHALPSMQQDAASKLASILYGR